MIALPRFAVDGKDSGAANHDSNRHRIDHSRAELTVDGVRRSWRSWIAVALASWILAGSVVAAGSQEPEAGEKPQQGSSTDNGFVIVNGRYLPPPYVLESRGMDLLINEQVIPMQGLGGWGRKPGPHGGRWRPPGRSGWGRGSHPGRPRPAFDPMARMVAAVHRQLDSGCMLVVTSDGKSRALGEGVAAAILFILLSDDTTEAKLRSLEEQYIANISSQQWEEMVRTFEPTDELALRAGPILERYQTLRDEHQATLARGRWYALLESRPVRYGVTVFTMMLAVVATGTLLIHRPATEGRWSEVNSARDGTKMVVRNVMLLALLGGFDLIFTLAAQQAGGFVELNPLGAGLIGSPILLTAFKAVTFAIACAMLFALRNYRGAQIASWWLCLVCTIVTVRWLVYDSLFMG